MLVGGSGTGGSAAPAVWWMATMSGGGLGVRPAPGRGAATRSAPARGRPRARPHVGARILVVDDEPQIRRVLRTALEDEGYEVREAADGVDALAVARVWRPDAIVLDLLMPAMNGWQFAEAYDRQQTRLDERRAPMIAITAAGPAAVRSAQAQGAISAVLPKPLDMDELSEALELHVGGQRPV